MFVYARNMQLAVKDILRRSAMQAAAGVVMLIGAGFLIAALWSFLAWYLDWGPLWASLVIGLLFVIAALVLFNRAGTVEHPVPSTDELKAEVETRLSLAADAALEKARLKADEVIGTAENKVHGLIDQASHRANALAEEAEARVQRFTRRAAGEAASRVGLTPRFLNEAQGTMERVRETSAATVPPLIAAFAAGLALANRLQGWRHRDDGYDDDDRDDDEDYRDGHDYYDPDRDLY